MPKSAKVIRIFLASPSDLKAERNCVAHVVELVNAQKLLGSEIVLDLVRWENCFPDTSEFGAQGVINQQTAIEDSDVFICMIGSQLGTPTERYRSGTLEEVARVTDSWASRRSPRLSFWFKAIDSSHPNYDSTVAKEIADFKAQVASQGSLYGSIPDDGQKFTEAMLGAIVNSAKRVLADEALTSKSAFVFGQSRESEVMHVVCGGLVLNPILTASILTDERLGSADERSRFSKYPLYKGDLKYRYSASTVVGSGEVRAVSHLMYAFGKPTAPRRLDSKVDREFKGWASDLIAIGAASNSFSRMIVADPNNRLVTPALFKRDPHDDQERCFISKVTGHPVHPALEKGEDYALIMRIAPQVNRKNTWLFCGGLGPWGTSAGAWFLANRWEELAESLTETARHFAALIKVTEGEDESGILQWVVTEPEQLERHPNPESFNELVRWDALPRNPSWLEEAQQALCKAGMPMPDMSQR